MFIVHIFYFNSFWKFFKNIYLKIDVYLLKNKFHVGLKYRLEISKKEKYYLVFKFLFFKMLIVNFFEKEKKIVNLPKGEETTYFSLLIFILMFLPKL